jgi:hypothetical protein
MAWKSVATSVTGDTPTLMKLRGRKVRTRSTLMLPTLEPTAPHQIGPQTTIRAGIEGFVGHVQPTANDLIPVAFAAEGSALPPTLDNLMRSGRFRVLRCNWATFSWQFDIDL